MSPNIQIGPLVAERGERKFGYLEVAPMAGGSPLRVGVHLISGEQPGPTLGLIATQHGDEVGPLAVLREVLNTVDIHELSGNLVVVPVANPIAFMYGHRSTWMDGLYNGTTGNMNRLWPGKPDGFTTERIAFVISEHVFAACDCFIDFHATVADGLALYYAYYMPEEREVGQKSRDMARYFGMEILMRRPGRHSGAGDTLSDYIFNQLRKPVVPVELGDFHGLDVDRPKVNPRSLLETGVTGTLNVMKYLGMLPGKPQLPQHQVIVSPETRCMPSAGGILYPEVTPSTIGHCLAKDTVLGRVISPYSFETLEEIRTPYEENILVSCRKGMPLAKVNPGDQCFHVADYSTAEWIKNY